MKRKAVRQGPGTIGVSLPTAWVRKYNVAKGQELDLQIKDNTIIISVEGTEKESKREFNVSDLNGFFQWYFVHYFYQKGYDEVLIRHDDPEVGRIIAEQVAGIMGFEIVEQGKQFTRIKALMMTDLQKFDDVLRKAFLVTIQMGDKVIEAVSKKDFSYLKDIARDEKINNKYCDLCQRILNKKKETTNSTYLYIISRELERLCDFYKFLCEDWNKNVSVLPSFVEVHNYVKLYYELYYVFDREKAERFFAQKYSLLTQLRKKIKKAYSDDILVLSHCINIVQCTFDMKGPIFMMKL